MGLFDLRDNKIVLDPEKITIPEFLVIWKEDKSKDKIKAERLLTYIYFLCDYNSPYAIYPENERKNILIEDYMKEYKKEIKKSSMLNAIEKYKAFQQTTSMKLLEAAKVACNKLSDYFHGVDFKELDEDGKPVYNAKDVALNLKSIGGIIESLNKTTDQVKKEITSSSKIRGGGEAGDYER